MMASLRQCERFPRIIGQDHEPCRAGPYTLEAVVFFIRCFAFNGTLAAPVNLYSFAPRLTVKQVVKVSHACNL